MSDRAALPAHCNENVPDVLQLLRSKPVPSFALTLHHGRDVVLRWKHRDLMRAADRYCRLLQEEGIGPGAVVCVIADNSPHFVALFQACLEIGCCFAPLHPDQRNDTLREVLRELRPALLIVEDNCDSQQIRRLRQVVPRILRLRLHSEACLRPILARTSDPRDVACAADQEAEMPDVALLLHSSGSTGAPKIITYTRARLSLFLHWQRRLFAAFPDAEGTNPPSPRVNALPLAHFGGLSFVLQALIDGRAVHLLRGVEPLDYLRLAVGERCQLLMFIPGLYDAVLRDAPGPLAGSALRYCLTMGEAVTPQLCAIIEQTLGARVYSAYGMSEALSGLGHHRADLPSGCCGQLLFGETRLVDCDPHGADAHNGDEGELWVRNATVAPCYRDPRLNARKFVDGWYRTGDRFRRDAQGRYFFLGRVDAMCIVNGRNVYPADVEQVLLAHPFVLDCMAATIVLDDGRRRFGALVCFQPDKTLTAAGLLDWFLRRGALHAAPAWLAFADAIPNNAAGKRDRNAVASVLQRNYAARLPRVS